MTLFHTFSSQFLKRYNATSFCIVFLLLCFSFLHGLAQPGPGTAPVVIPTGGFAVEGNLQANTPATGIGDWLPGPTGAGGNVLLSPSGLPVNTATTFHLTDLYSSSSDNNFSGGLKFDQNPNQWTWVTNPVGDKVDINNALFHFTKSANGHQWIVVAADRGSNNGDAYIDFEFLQDTLSIVSSPTKKFVSSGPDGGRTKNDFVLTLALTKGGSSAGFFVERWQAVPVSTQAPAGFDYVDRTASIPAGSTFASVNTTSVPVAFGAFGSTTYATNTFAEAAVDLTALLGSFDPCTELGIKTIFIKTKESQSPTATIVDFITPQPVSVVLGVADAGVNQSVCSGGATTNFSLSGSATPSPGDALQSSTWSVVSGAATFDNASSLTTIAHVTSAPATIRLTVKTNFGCTVTDDVVLSTIAGPTVSADNKSVCTGNTVALSGSPAGGTWSGANVSGSTFNAAALAPGNYTATYTVTGTNGCSGSANATITVVANPSALLLTGSAICTSAAGTGTITSSTSGGSSISYQLYNSSNTTVQSAKTGTGSALTWSGLAAGNGYYVIATASGSATCSSTSNLVNITTVANPAALVLTGSAICAATPNTGTISSSASGNNTVSYQLYDGTSSPVQAAKAGTGAALTWSNLPTGNGYYVIATGPAPTNCTSNSNAVNVVVGVTPAALVLSGSSICVSAPNTGTVSSATSGDNTISYQLYNAANAPVQSPKAGTGAALTWSNLPTGTGYYVIGTGPAPTSCTSTSNTVDVSDIANPSAPDVTYVPPACTEVTFKVTVNNPAAGATYTIVDKNGASIPGVSPSSSVTAANSNSFTFSNIPAGSGYQVSVSLNGCQSGAATCGASQGARIAKQPVTSSPEIKQITSVKAYPNPFSTRIKFVVNSEVSGNGNLDLYNLMGQKIKTVYQGYIAAGSQSFELTMTAKQVANMFYVLRIGNKKMSGKIMQINP
ncbi:MAG: hypothetical protein JWR61_2478 [Ferruginibacter sp.]|uniref:hypothetical protein n=1 Tax=Ferruginibacter sp. TaxID=1940288 RepID=UPI002658CEE3|nr:hypothetical protein [Ferruginibacter sp.]MDB5277523.1 hypothetical protein [Ferruginibacter sp.]